MGAVVGRTGTRRTSRVRRHGPGRDRDGGRSVSHMGVRADRGGPPAVWRWVFDAAVAGMAAYFAVILTSEWTADAAPEQRVPALLLAFLHGAVLIARRRAPSVGRGHHGSGVRGGGAPGLLPRPGGTDRGLHGGRAPRSSDVVVRARCRGGRARGGCGDRWRAVGLVAAVRHPARRSVVARCRAATVAGGRPRPG